MAKREITKLTPVQREILQALRDGAMITIDRMNMPWLRDRMLQPATRYFLTDNGLITRLDKSRSVEASGNGFVISDKGLALLEKLPPPRSRRNEVVAVNTESKPSPPTEKQLAFARDLGIDIPSNATLDEVSDLISARLERDRPANENHRRIAALYGVTFTRFIGKKQLYQRIFNMVSRPTREFDLTSWFVYRVYRHLVRGFENAPINGPDHPTIKEIATGLVSDQSAIRSIRRYTADSLLFFGEWTSPDGVIHTGGSKRTAGYEKASQLLKQKMNLSE